MMVVSWCSFWALLGISLRCASAPQVVGNDRKILLSESKSDYFTSDFKAHSEKLAESDPRCINRLPDDSE
jgi:hypothetical protein